MSDMLSRRTQTYSLKGVSLNTMGGVCFTMSHEHHVLISSISHLIQPCYVWNVEKKQSLFALLFRNNGKLHPRNYEQLV